MVRFEHDHGSGRAWATGELHCPKCKDINRVSAWVIQVGDRDNQSWICLTCGSFSSVAAWLEDQEVEVAPW